MAFIFDSPANIFFGLGRIFSQRGLLITDYMVVGGLGASIINSTIACVYGVAVLYFMKAKPSGAAIMCLWMTAGWTYWGANVLNIFPLTFGVWLFSKYKKKPFSDYVVAALLIHTIAPIVSVFYVSNPVAIHFGVELPLAVNILIGVVVGLFIGFMMPAVLAAVLRAHQGFTLYNMGVAGGMIALFVAAGFRGAGVDVPTESMWYTDRQFEIALFLYIICGALVLAGLFPRKWEKADHWANIKDLISRCGHVENDFYYHHGSSTYINMGVMGALGTTWALVFGIDLNAGTFACIYSMIAFGSLGKHVRNVLPLLAGATICAFLNSVDFLNPTNALAILFSSCLAPIAGKFGFGWGLVAGFLHVLMVIQIGPVTNGFNLYNNGFASGFIALILVPIIMALKRSKEKE